MKCERGAFKTTLTKELVRWYDHYGERIGREARALDDVGKGPRSSASLLLCYALRVVRDDSLVFDARYPMRLTTVDCDKELDGYNVFVPLKGEPDVEAMVSGGAAFDDLVKRHVGRILQNIGAAEDQGWREFDGLDTNILVRGFSARRIEEAGELIGIVNQVPLSDVYGDPDDQSIAWLILRLELADVPNTTFAPVRVLCMHRTEAEALCNALRTRSAREWDNLSLRQRWIEATFSFCEDWLTPTYEIEAEPETFFPSLLNRCVDSQEGSQAVKLVRASCELQVPFDPLRSWYRGEAAPDSGEFLDVMHKLWVADLERYCRAEVGRRFDAGGEEDVA